MTASALKRVPSWNVTPSLMNNPLSIAFQLVSGGEHRNEVHILIVAEEGLIYPCLPQIPARIVDGWIEPVARREGHDQSNVSGYRCRYRCQQQ